MCRAGDLVREKQKKSVLGGKYSDSPARQDLCPEGADGDEHSSGEEDSSTVHGRVLEVFSGAKEALAYVSFPMEKPRWAFVRDLEIISRARE